MVQNKRRLRGWEVNSPPLVPPDDRLQEEGGLGVRVHVGHGHPDLAEHLEAGPWAPGG